MHDALSVLRRVCDFATATSCGLAPGALLEKLLEDVVALTGAQRALVIQLTSSDATVRTIGGIGDAENQFSRTLIARMLDERRTIQLDVRSDDGASQTASIAAANVRAVMCAPIWDRQAIAGALYVSTVEDRCFSNEDAELLTLYANQASIVMSAIERERAAARKQGKESQNPNVESSLLGSSISMKTLRAELQRVAPYDISVLLLGETGTGKELAAEEIHRKSARKGGPFVPVHCAALPRELLASELFGHLRGAFTGAVESRLGWIRSADQGTLFLDEIGELSPEQQVHLLRVLQERQVTPLGGTQSHPVDFRLIAATNRNLAELVAKQLFREDLYYRIAEITLTIPPLRDRVDDAVEIALALLQRYRARFGTESARLSAGAITALKYHNWPGNVRELDAAIRKGLILCNDGVIESQHLGLKARAHGDKFQPLQAARDAFLKEYVQEAITRFGSRAKAAEMLEVSERTVYKYLDEVD